MHRKQSASLFFVISILPYSMLIACTNFLMLYRGEKKDWILMTAFSTVAKIKHAIPYEKRVFFNHDIGFLPTFHTFLATLKKKTRLSAHKSSSLMRIFYLFTLLAALSTIEVTPTH